MSDTLLTHIAPTGAYTPPPAGDQNAVLVDVFVIKDEPTKWGNKNHVYFYFETEAKMDDGRPFLASCKFTASMNSKANLPKFISKWTGTRLGQGESIELKSLIGKGAILEIEHQVSQTSGNTYAKIDRARPVDANKTLAPSGDYDGSHIRKRAEERAEERRQQEGYDSADPAPTVRTDDDDVPF